MKSTIKEIIIDTNALMAVAEWGIDIFSEIEKACDFRHEILVAEGTIRELQKIQQEQRSKFKRAAGLALAILKSKKIAVLPGEGEVDDVLAAQSQQGYMVLTQDRGLKRRLRKPYLTIRQKKRVIVVK